MKPITAWIAEKGTSVEALEAVTGLDPGVLAAICAGRFLASAEQRRKIAAALGLQVDDITWGHATPTDHMYGF